MMFIISAFPLITMTVLWFSLSTESLDSIFHDNFLSSLSGSNKENFDPIIWASCELLSAGLIAYIGIAACFFLSYRSKPLSGFFGERDV
jgi:hypothetical protein